MVISCSSQFQNSYYRGIVNKIDKVHCYLQRPTTNRTVRIAEETQRALSLGFRASEKLNKGCSQKMYPLNSIKIPMSSPFSLAYINYRVPGPQILVRKSKKDISVSD